MKPSQRLACLLLTTAAAVFAPATGAAEFWTYVPGSGSLKVNNPGGGADFAPVNVTGYSGSGGQFNGFFWNAATRPADAFFRFFCIDLDQYANKGPNSYQSSLHDDDWIRKLYDVAYPNKAAGDFWDGAAQTGFGVFGSANSAAAFQVALWNLYFDGDLSLAAGGFQWTGAPGAAVAVAAQELLDQVGAYSGNGYQRWTLYRFDNDTYQNYLSATYKVPEPGIIALLLASLSMLALVLRRRPKRVRR